MFLDIEKLSQQPKFYNFPVHRVESEEVAQGIEVAEQFSVSYAG
jgi:hypothetical protein